MTKDLIKGKEYLIWLSEIKDKIRSVQIRAALSASRELIHLYWFLGKEIEEKQQYAQWGSGFINRFSKDLQEDFPDITGFSPKNLRYCRAFYRFYSVSEKWQQAVAKLKMVESSEKWQQIVAKMETAQLDENDLEYLIGRLCAQVTWSHNIHIFTNAESIIEALFYINETIENGWGRDALALQIKSDLFNRQGKAVTNFKNTLPSPQSDLAQQTIKDPYTFDFMTMTKPYNELDIEKKLVDHIAKFLMELGKGFAFLGRQYPLEVDGNSYYLDLLFYHTKLKCYVVVELKNTKFIPEYAGKLNFYLSAVDSMVKAEDDNPTIGLLLCRDKSNIEVEFSLRDMKKPIGVSEYIITEALPDNLKGSMPTVEEIEADLSRLGIEEGGNNEQ